MIQVIKRIFDRAVWANRTFERFAGSGTLGGDLPSFDQQKAVDEFRSWAYIAANIVARECSQHPLRLFVRDDGRRRLYATRPMPKARKRYLSGLGDNKPSVYVLRKSAEFGDDFVEVTESHPAITTLCDPNPWMNGFDMTVLRWVYLQLTGNAYLHPVSHIQLGTPESVWLMPPQWTRVVPDEDEFIRGYTYGTDDSNKEFFEADEVIHFKMPNPTDMYYGRGVLESIWSVWALHGHKRTMDLAHFENRARPDWIAAFGGVNEESIKRFEQKMESRHRGSRNGGRMGTVGTKDFSLHQLNFPPDVISDPDRVLDEIAGGFGVHRARITGNQAIAGGASEQADITMLRGTIAPLLRSDEETLNNQWLPLFGIDQRDAFLAYDNPVPSDKEFDRETVNQQIATGRITINAANAIEGLEPVDGGDVPRVNGVPLDQVGALPPAPAFTFNAPSAPRDTIVVGGGEPPALPAPTKTLGPPDPAVSDTPVGRFIDKMFTKIDADRDIRDDEPEQPVNRMQRDLADLLSDSEDALLAGISAGGAVDVEALLGDFEQGVFDATLEPVTEALSAGGVAGLDEIDVSQDVFNVTNERVAESIQAFNLRLAGEVAQTTVSAVQETLSQGVDAGESVDQLRQRVTDTGKFSPQRAEAIARTESARGYVTGKELGWQESGVVTGKKWLLAPGACPYCREAARIFNARPNGTPLGQSFLNDGDSITPPGRSPLVINAFNKDGPLHPNDRCDIVAVIQE